MKNLVYTTRFICILTTYFVIINKKSCNMTGYTVNTTKIIVSLTIMTGTQTICFVYPAIRIVTLTELILVFPKSIVEYS